MGKIRNLKELKPELFDDSSKVKYSYDKNEGINPERLELTNKDELWFIGTSCNHEFKTTIGNILRKDRENKCPYCEGKKILVGFNDLKTKYPSFFNGENKVQWNEEKNREEGISLSDVSDGCHKQIWFICNNGHEWKANTHNVFMLGKGCPYCSGKKSIVRKNDLTITHPEIAKQWNYEKNDTKPEDYRAGSNKKVWWKTTAERYDKIWILEWEDRIDTRTIQNAGCPYLTNKKVLEGFNDFKTWCIHNNKQDLLNEWDYEKNGDLKPENCLDGGSKYVWWKKTLYKNDRAFKVSWKASIRHRQLGIGDPYSSVPAKFVLKGYNDLASCYPEVAKEWNFSKNGELKPDEVIAKSNKKVWWKCGNCGAEWQTTISNRTGTNNNCPHCASSKGEKRISLFLDDKKIKYNQEYTFDDCVYVAKLRFDFAIFDKNNMLTCLVEYDGEAHDKPISFGCKDKNEILKRFKQTKIRDTIKNEYCEKNNIPLIRIHYTKFNEIENILEEKFKELGLIP